MRVLALVPGDISEQLLFFPTLETIKATYPQSDLSVMVEPRSVSAYRVSKAVSDVIPFNYQAQNSPADWANILGVIRDREFELVLCASYRWEESLLLWLSGIPDRVGYDSATGAFFYTKTVTPASDASQSETYQALLQGITAAPQPDLTVNVPEQDIAWAEQQRQALDLNGKGYVLMYPGPSQAGDSYPTASWSEIIEDFQAKQPQLPVTLLDTADSHGQVATLARGRSEIKQVAPANLGQTAAMVAGADLVISPNGPISILATALRVFTLVLANRQAAELPAAEEGETRLLTLRSSTDTIADLPPGDVLQKIWGA